MQENPFKKGDRVAIRPGVKKQGIRCGIISTSPRHANLVTVIWDGTKSPATYHIDLIEHAAVARS